MFGTFVDRQLFRKVSFNTIRYNFCQYLWIKILLLNTCREPVASSPASKVFLIDDLVGQWYLCYILPSRFQLSVVKIDFSSSINVSFGVLTSISAKDAVPISVRNMLNPYIKILTILILAFAYVSNIRTQWKCYTVLGTYDCWKITYRRYFDSVHSISLC